MSSHAFAGVPLVLRAEGSGTRAAVDALVAERAAAGSPAPLELDDGLAVQKCVEAGAGYAFVSRLAAAEALAAGRLRLVALAGTPVRRRFWAAWLKRSTLPPAARPLVEAIQKNR
jgi:DNA-binding transcriptional LysR family regulator